MVASKRGEGAAMANGCGLDAARGGNANGAATRWEGAGVLHDAAGRARASAARGLPDRRPATSGGHAASSL